MGKTETREERKWLKCDGCGRYTEHVLKQEVRVNSGRILGNLSNTCLSCGIDNLSGRQMRSLKLGW